MELLNAIKERRSVRRFTDYNVTDDEIKELLEAARIAPSWANTQTWEFIVVRDKNLIQSVTETYSETNPARKCSMAASVLIIGCAKKGVAGCYSGKEVTAYPYWHMFDLGLAVQNLCLRAHDLGLGTVIVGFMDHKKCEKILSVPEGYDLLVSIPVGKPAVAAKEGPPRKELKDFVYKNTFGNK